MHPIASLRRAGVLAFVAFAAAAARADYPLVSHRYLADPGALVHDGRVYLYCSNDDENPVGGGYVMKSLVCVSTADLKNWTDHGVVFQVPRDASWAGYAWAPAVVARNGTFYLYFGNNASGIGVASSRSPTGPFTDAKGGYLVNASTPGASGPNIWLFDPAVFIDDDSQAYLYFGGNGVSNARVIKLNADMISTTGSAATIDTPNFFEAAWMHKRNGVYYFSYSSNPSSGLTIDYLTSSSPMSGFTYAGTVAGQPPSNNNNNHHAIFSFNGNWYHAYHNRAVATAAGIPTGYRRNLGLERLDYAADGAIQRITYTTDGVAQLGHLDAFARVEAETTNAQSGITTEPCSAGGMNVRFTTSGAWVRLRGVDFGSSGAMAFTASVAATGSGGTLELRLGSETGTVLGRCPIPVTGSAQTWTTTACSVTGAVGVQDIVLRFTSTASAPAGVDWWRFERGPVIVSPPADQIVFPGSALRLSVAAAGTGISYQWLRDGVPVAGATEASLTLPNATSAIAGTYTVTITSPAGAVTSRGAVVQVSPDASRLVNMSCRTPLTAGQLVSPGFYVAGTGTKRLVIRVAGPALASFGLSNTMPDPQVRLYRGSEVIAQNDNWDATLADTFTQVGAFAFAAGSRDAALVIDLPAGNTYTAQVGGVGASSGIVLLEVYDADGVGTTAKLSNIALRGTPGSGDASLVLGFVMRGVGDRTFLVRGAGPALTAFGVNPALPDPQLAVYDANAQLRSSNSGWNAGGDAIASAAAAVGAFPFAANSRDAALLLSVPTSAYTVQITSASGAPGETLAEVYEVR